MLRSKILCFNQNQEENMYQTWTCSKQMLNDYLYRKQVNYVLDHTFFKALDYNTHMPE